MLFVIIIHMHSQAGGFLLLQTTNWLLQSSNADLHNGSLDMKSFASFISLMASIAIVAFAFNMCEKIVQKKNTAYIINEADPCER